MAAVRVGLTGGIGAGKSTVAARFAEHGAVVIDADKLAREVVEPGTEGLAEVVAAFGEDVLRPDGSLDRPALGRVVFGDEEKRKRLNGILHPRIGRRTGELMSGLGDDDVVVHDVPLLVEGNLAAGYHLVVIVHAPEEERVRRLVEDRGMSAEDAWARVRAQATDEQRRAVGGVWIENTGTREATLAQVDECWRDRVEPLRGKVT